MNRTLVLALILVLLVPVGAAANDWGLTGGFFGQSTETNGLAGSSVSAFTIGPMVYSDNWLLDLGMSFVLSDENPDVAAPAYGGFSMGYMFGRDATRTRPFFMLGVNATVDNGQFNSGPKITAGLSKSMFNDATLVIAGAETYYTFATEEVGYRIIGKFVFKLGPSSALPTDAGAGGETPRGLFPAQ